MSTRRPRRACGLAVIAMALVACGGGVEGDARPAGKAEGVGGEAVSRSISLPVSRSPVPGATRPARADDVAVRVQAPTPIGPVAAAIAHTYPARVEVRNTSGDRVSIERMWLHASVYRDGYLVGDCGDEDAELVTSQRTELDPGQSYVIMHGLPCALSEPGRYELASVVMVGMPPEAAGLEHELGFQKAVRTALEIDASLPEFQIPLEEAPLQARSGAAPRGDAQRIE